MSQNRPNAAPSPYNISTTAKTQAITSVAFASCRRCILTISYPQKILGQLLSAVAVVGVLVPHDRWVLR